jgi:hypothetical protein
MATEAAWLKRKKEKTSNKKGKRKTDLTLTGLLMEGPYDRKSTSLRETVR